MIKVSKINEGSLRDFERLPFELYRDDGLWCPRSSSEISAWFRKAHPLSPSIEFIPFLATRDGRAIGRCAAFVNRRRADGFPPAGSIGFYECEKDEATSAALISAALSALAQAGCVSASAPMDGSIWGQYRFMTSGSATRTFYGEPRNKPWYPAQLESAGFIRVKTWSSVFLGREGEERLLARLSANRDRALASGYSVRQADPRRIGEEYRSIHAMIMESYAGFTGFTPVDAEEFAALFKNLPAVWDPSLAFIAVAPDGSDAGFNIVLPDPSKALRAMRGSSSFLAVLRFLANRDPRSDLVDLYLGAKPSAIKAGSGVGALLGHCACQASLKRGRGFVMALVSDSSTVNARIPQAAEEIHRYALWERKVDERT